MTEKMALAWQGKLLKEMTHHELCEALSLVGLWARLLAIPDENWLTVLHTLNDAIQWQPDIPKETKMADKRQIKDMTRQELIALVEEFKRLSKLYYPPIWALAAKSLE